MKNGFVEMGGRHVEIKDGYLQEPKEKAINGKRILLGSLFEHVSTGNQYIVKEIQLKGVLAKLVRCPITGLIGKDYYISNSRISEYGLKG